MSARRRTPAPILFVLLATLVAVPMVRADETAIRGTPFVGAAGVHRSVAEMMGDGASRVGRDPRMAERKKQRPDRTGLLQPAEALPVAQWPPAAPGLGAQSVEGTGATMTQPYSLTFTGATLFGTNPTFSFPPDCMGAVGPTQYVVAVNGRIVTFDKATGLADGVMNLDMDVFFNPVRDGSSTSDPRIRYDRLTGRWFVVIINVSTPNRILIAVSDAASATQITLGTIWTFFFIPIDTTPPAISNTCFADYPTLGVDANALYIGANNFCGASLTFNSCDGYVVRKSSVLGAGPIVVTALRGLVPSAASDGPYTPQGVDHFDPAAAEGYFIGVSNIAFSRLVLRRVSDPAGTPTASTNIVISTATTTFPINAHHLGNTGGTNGRLSAVDDRLFAAHIRNDRLWTAHSIGLNNTGVASGTITRTGSRWYELQNIATPGIPGISQAGTVFSASATNNPDQPHWWIPSVMVSGQGHATMGVSTAGENERANVAITGRLTGDAPGTMFAPVLTTASATAYNPPSDPGSPGIGRRWGDYTYTSLDPLDDMTMWTVQQFCDATNSYGVQVVRMTPPPPALPLSATDVTAGDASKVTVVTGSAAGGAGFYDPGPDLPGVPAFSHLTATVTNTGVTGTPPTVNSFTYIDPTHIQLDLNTTAATASLPGEKYTVVVTNPDGQMVAGAVLTVLPSVAAVEPVAGGFGLQTLGPHPAAGPTVVEFSLGRESEVKLAVVDVLGREIAVLASGIRPAGRHRTEWNGETAAGRAPTGLYFLRYQADGQTAMRRIVRIH